MKLLHLKRTTPSHLCHYQRVDRQWGGRWVYASKEDNQGNETYKPRYAAKGYSQVEGLDFSETLSLTACCTA